MKRILFFFMSLLAVLVGLITFKYFFIGNQTIDPNKMDPFLFEQIVHFKDYIDELNPWFLLHIIFGSIAIIIGWPQFLENFRKRHTDLHKLVGYIYSSAVFLGGIGGGYIALKAVGGIPAQAGFFCLSVIWVSTLFIAIVFLLKGNYQKHGLWLKINYAITLAALTLRLEGAVFVFFGLEPEFSYQITAWSSWTGNLIILYAIEKWKTR